MCEINSVSGTVPIHQVGMILEDPAGLTLILVYYKTYLSLLTLLVVDRALFAWTLPDATGTHLWQCDM